MDQETTLALCKKAAEQRMEAMKEKRPKPIIKEIPATVKSSKHCKLNPINAVIYSPKTIFKKPKLKRVKERNFEVGFSG